jgi:hypothetical protein
MVPEVSTTVGSDAAAQFFHEHRFHPWNWRPQQFESGAIIQDNPERLSLSIHGCDHTGGEFGSLNVSRLAWKSRSRCADVAASIQNRTAARAVMVFPQGVFFLQGDGSFETKPVPGCCEFRNSLHGSDGHTIKIEDYWQVGVLNYSEFPIFTADTRPQALRISLLIFFSANRAS